ncbi:MAG: hypothetical protein U0641_05590 [Anaerolineae bacterium]
MPTSYHLQLHRHLSRLSHHRQRPHLQVVEQHRYPRHACDIMPDAVVLVDHDDIKGVLPGVLQEKPRRVPILKRHVPCHALIYVHPGHS